MGVSPEPEDVGPWRTFVNDLSASARTLRATPTLVILTLVLHLAFAGDLIATDLDRRSRNTCLLHHPLSACPPHAWVVLVGLPYLLVALFLVGFGGPQRVWFMRAHRGQPTDRSAVWRLNWSFFGRYFALSLATVPIAIPYFVLVAVKSRHTIWAPSFAVSIAFYLTWFVLEVFATFVTAALAFSTERVRVAIPEGFRMLVRSWPQTVWYAAAPPLTIFLIGADFIRRRAGLTSAIVVSALVAPLLGLWFKSATALFYLRRVPAVGPYGAAMVPGPTCINSHPVTEGARFCAVCGVALQEPLIR
jgi:hypothetical protein